MRENAPHAGLLAIFKFSSNTLTPPQSRYVCYTTLYASCQVRNYTQYRVKKLLDIVWGLTKNLSFKMTLFLHGTLPVGCREGNYS